MRRYWATLAGVVVGLLGGFYGALFGGAIGLLVDLVLNEYRGSRRTREFLSGEEAPEWLPMMPILCGALLGRMLRVPFQGNPGPFVDATLEFRSIVVPRRVLERMLQVAALEEWRREETLEAAFSNRLDSEERRRAIQAVWNYLRSTPDAREARPSMEAFAREVVKDGSFVEQTIVIERRLHAESCEVLGVSRDAGRTDIQKAYRKLAAHFHPDAAVGLSPEQQQVSEQAFKRITAAYERLLAESENP
jgi:DnaJ-domain-containing protein 1